MATVRELGVKFTEEGLDRLQKRAEEVSRSIGRSFEDAVARSRDAVARAGTGNLDKEVERQAKALQQTVNGAFRHLGVRSGAELDKLRAKAQSAFNAIKQSGVASANDIAKAQEALNRRLAEIDRLGSGAGRRAPTERVNALTTSIDRLKVAVASYLSLDIARRAIRQADAYKTLQDRVRDATRETGDFNQVSRETFEISQRTGVALENTVGVFQSLSLSREALSATNEEILKVVQAVLQLSADARPENLSAGLLQFSQGLGAGVLRAEEFNSLLENIPKVADRIAKGFGVTTAELRQAVLDGKVLSKDVFRVLLEQVEEINEEFSDRRFNLNQSFNVLLNSTGKFLSGLDDAVGLTDALAAGMRNVAVALDAADIEGVADLLKDLAIVVAGLIAARTLGPQLAKLGTGATAFAGGLTAANAAILITQARAAALRGTLTALEAVMKVLGGKAGLIILAATAFAVLATREDKVAKATDRAKKARDELNEVLKKGTDLSKAEAQAAVDRARETLKAARADLEAAIAAREKNAALAAGLSPNSRLQDVLGKGGTREMQAEQEIARLRAQVQGLEGDLAGAEQKYSSLLDDPDKPKRPKFDFGGGTGAKGAANDLKQILDTRLALTKDALEREQRALERSLEDNLISYSRFYDERIRLQQQAIDEEIRIRREELKLATDKGDVARLTADITLLERRRTDVALEGRREQLKAERELAAELRQIQAELLVLQGETAQAAILDIEARFTPTLDRLRAELNDALANGDIPTAGAIERQIDIVVRLKDSQTAIAQFEQVHNELDAIAGRFATQQERLSIDVEAGLIGELEARQSLLSVYQASIPEIEALISRMRELAEATGSQELAQQVAEAEVFLERVKKANQDIAGTINNEVRNSFAGMFSDIAKGAKGVEDAVADMAARIHSVITDLVAQKLAEQIFSSLFGPNGATGFNPGAFVATLFGFKQGGLVPGYADGGLIAGPGTGTSDSIAAAVPAGSFVLKAAAVRRYGVGALNQLAGLADAPRGGDQVPVKVSNGEYLFGPGIVNRLGRQFFDRLNGMRISQAGIADYLGSVQRYATGGLVLAGGGSVSLDAVEPARKSGGNGNGAVNLNMTVMTPDANSFRKSEGQLGRDAAIAFQRSLARNG